MENLPIEIFVIINLITCLMSVGLSLIWGAIPKINYAINPRFKTANFLRQIPLLTKKILYFHLALMLLELIFCLFVWLGLASAVVAIFLLNFSISGIIASTIQLIKLARTH